MSRDYNRAKTHKAEVMSDSYAFNYDRPDRFMSKLSTNVPPGVDPIVDRINKRRQSREARERSEKNRTISDERAFRRRSPYFENPVYPHRPDLDP